jgi:DNA polymerase II large subunit
VRKYFIEIKEKTDLAYALATKARAKGYDPEMRVDIPLTASVPERSEQLVASAFPELNNSGTAARIKELEKQYGHGDWRVALTIADEVSAQSLCKFKDEITAINAGAKVALAYLTLGIIAAPLEGLVEIKFKDRMDGGKYLAVYFAGPIRAAGGTALSTGSMIVDYIRIRRGIPRYDITDIEIKRYQTEIADYLRLVGHRQYVPTDEELAFIVTHIGVEISGEPTEKYEVSRYKRVDRVETPKIRGGMVLVVTEGPALKAEKLAKQLNKWGKDFGFTGWMWINEFIELKHKLHYVSDDGGKDDGEDEVKIKPGLDYLGDIVAGRPIFGHPMRPGALRLRYGRARNSGFAAMAMSPVTLKILNEYVATGTQLKVERPGKATIINPCDQIEGPRVRLKNGDYLWLETEEQADEVKKEIEEITFIGDILICYGDFSENGKRLAPAGYCEEWWAQELKLAIEKKAAEQPAEHSNITEKILSALHISSKDQLDKLVTHPLSTKISAKQAISLSKHYGVPLHPKYTFHWADIDKSQLVTLLNWMTQHKNQHELALNPEGKRVLELIGCPHRLKDNKVIIDKEFDTALRFTLGLEQDSEVKLDEVNAPLELVNQLSGITIKDKSGTYIGTRMGRPEKAKLRAMKGSPHGLFPVGKEGDRTRSLQKAMEVGQVTAEFQMFACDACGNNTIYPVCEKCGTKTTQWFRCPMCKRSTKERECHRPTLAYKRRKLDINYYVDNAKNYLKIRQLSPLIKGVRGTSNKDHIPENLCKAVLRARHKLYVNKDGTIRYDMTETAQTHFRPEEIGTPVKKLHELGYTHDYDGKELKHKNQLVEILPQDVILPACEEVDDEGADQVIFRITKFIDELLVRFYHLEPFYNLKTPQDLIGHLVIGLAPHTSGGIMGRIIGFSKTQGCYSHPYWHAAQRRNLDGDETCVILALDAFLNFSRQYLPDRRGGRAMDAPLVLTTLLNPLEVDDEVHGMDIAAKYDLDFYAATLEAKWPWEVKVAQVKHVLDTPAQYETLKFTHDVQSMNSGVRVSAYKFIPTMVEKLEGQIDLANKLRAVDVTDVGRLVIEKHFIKDIKGNLRKWSLQQYRCVKCNEKYRRPPLAGKCTKCFSRLLFTIAEGSIKKYMGPSMLLAEQCDVSAYLKQTLNLLNSRIDSVFGVERTKQQGLSQFFGGEKT